MKFFYPLALSMVALALVSTACGDDEVGSSSTTTTTGVGGSSSATGGNGGGGGSTSQGGGGQGGKAQGGAGGQGGNANQGGGGAGQGGSAASGKDCLMCLQTELNAPGTCNQCGTDAACAVYLECLSNCTKNNFSKSCFDGCKTDHAGTATDATQACLMMNCNTAADCSSVW